MSDWMEYLYMQQPMPTDVTGVPIRLSYLNDDGSMTEIATVTTDAAGSFGYFWAPPGTGTYRIVATVDGTAAFAPTMAQAYMGVGEGAAESPSTTSTVSPTPGGPPGEMPLTDIYIIAAAIVVIVVVALAALILRRRS